MVGAGVHLVGAVEALQAAAGQARAHQQAVVEAVLRIAQGYARDRHGEGSQGERQQRSVGAINAAGHGEVPLLRRSR